MLDIRHLEQQWLRYKLKKYIPFMVTLVAVVLILTLALLFFFKQPAISQHTTASQTPASSTAVPQKHLHVAETPTTQHHETPDINAVEKATGTVQAPRGNTASSRPYQPKKLEPSYDFLNKISYEAETKIELPPKPKQPSQPKPKPKPKPQRQQLNTNIAPAAEEKIDTILQPTPTTAPKAVASTPSPSIPKGIKISRIKSQGEIQDIIHRFKANKSPVLGLYLARYYYKMQQYEKAYNYALSTNNIDPNIEESWLIFASSLMKLSKKAQAVKTLKAYIKNSGSLNAKSLLDTIQNGAFQ